MIVGLYVIGGILLVALALVFIVIRVLDRCEPVDPEDPD